MSVDAGHEGMVGILLEHKADVEAVGDNGATALMLASSLGHEGIVRLLIKGGANLHAQHKFAGATALHYAAEV